MNFPCPYSGCTRRYSTKKILRRHVRALHEGDTQFQCPHCEKFLSSGQNLREHIYTHTGAYPYVCVYPNCGASFRQGSQYCAHKRIHRHLRTNGMMQRDVASISLTKLLADNPGVLEFPQSEETGQTETHSFTLPTIRGLQCMKPLPTEWLYENLR